MIPPTATVGLSRAERAVALSLLGTRAGQVVLDLAPDADLGRAALAGAGAGGVLVSLCGPGASPAGLAVHGRPDAVPLAGACVQRVLLCGGSWPERSVLAEARRVLAAGGRLVALRPGTHDPAGLSGDLAAAGLRLLHAEALDGPGSGRAVAAGPT